MSKRKQRTVNITVKLDDMPEKLGSLNDLIDLAHTVEVEETTTETVKGEDHD